MVDGLGNFFLVRNSSLFIGELISPENTTEIEDDENNRE
jgi:hypothetical protein